FKPDIIIAAHQQYDDPTRPQAMIGPKGFTVPHDPDFESMLATMTRNALTQLRAPGRTVVLVEPIPVTPRDFDPVSCLSTAKSSKDCTYKARTKATPLEQLYRTLGKEPGTASLNLDPLVCPRDPTCDAVVGNIIVKRDGTHLTATYAQSLAPAVES